MSRVRYCSKQIKFLENHFLDSPKLTPEYRKAIEDKFLKSFGFFRSSEAMRHKARKLSLRPKKGEALQVGVSITFHGGKRYLILVSDNPISWMTVERYKWEQVTGEKLTDDDVVHNVKGLFRDPDFKDLRKVTRAEQLRINLLSSDIPLETRILIAKIDDLASSLSGQGSWSQDELKYLETNGKRSGNSEFWKRLTERLNLKFNKKRKYRHVMSMYYYKVNKHEKI